MVYGVNSGLGNYYNNQIYQNPYEVSNNPILFGQTQDNTQNTPIAQEPKNEKVGFWEGVKAFGKGLIKPFTEIIKHPIKSALVIGGAAALCIATGGAATPFLIAAGLGLGAWQVGKGAVNFATSKNREETLNALEDMGSGTTAIGLSALGAKAQMGANSATVNSASNVAALGKDASIWAKVVAHAKDAGHYVKGLGKDSWTVAKQAPGSIKDSFAILKSGEGLANIKGALTATKLQHMHHKLAKTRLKYGSNSPEYIQAKADYNAKLLEFKNTQATNTNKALDKYTAAETKIDTSTASGQKQLARLQKLKGNLIENGVRTNPINTSLKWNNIYSKLPAFGTATAINSNLFSDNSQEYIEAPAYPQFVNPQQQYNPYIY